MTTRQVWDSRNYVSPVREWSPRSGPASALEWSQRGVLAVASGGTVNVRLKYYGIGNPYLAVIIFNSTTDLYFPGDPISPFRPSPPPSVPHTPSPFWLQTCFIAKI